MTALQLNINTPESITAPKFQLFQRVSFELNCYGYYSDRKAKIKTGLITGIEYITFTEALVRELDSYGWRYTINFLREMSQEELLEADEADAVEKIWEAKLKLVDGDSIDKANSTNL